MSQAELHLLQSHKTELQSKIEEARRDTLVLREVEQMTEQLVQNSESFLEWAARAKEKRDEILTLIQNGLNSIIPKPQ